MGDKNLGGNSMEMAFQVLGQETTRKWMSMSKKKTKKWALGTHYTIQCRGGRVLKKSNPRGGRRAKKVVSWRLHESS